MNYTLYAKYSVTEILCKAGKCILSNGLKNTNCSKQYISMKFCSITLSKNHSTILSKKILEIENKVKN